MIQLTVGWASPTGSNTENILVDNALPAKCNRHKVWGIS